MFCNRLRFPILVSCFLTYIFLNLIKIVLIKTLLKVFKNRFFKVNIIQVQLTLFTVMTHDYMFIRSLLNLSTLASSYELTDISLRYKLINIYIDDPYLLQNISFNNPAHNNWTTPLFYLLSHDTNLIKDLFYSKRHNFMQQNRSWYWFFSFLSQSQLTEYT